MGPRWLDELKPHCPVIEAEPHFADAPKDRGGQNCVLEASENVAQAALQGVGREHDGGAGIVEGKHGHVARGARQRLERLLRVEGTPRIGGASLGDRLILPGNEIEIMRTRCAQPSFEFADPELHDVVIGLRAFGEEALGFGRGRNQLGERAKANAAGKSRQSGLTSLNEPLRGCAPGIFPRHEWILEGACSGTNLSAIV